MSTIGPNQNQLAAAEAYNQPRIAQNNGPVVTGAPGDVGAINAQGPVDRGPNARNVANTRLHENWKSMASGDSYKMMFGDKAFVSDLKDENLRGILMELPDEACPGLKEKAQKGTLQPADIKQLQGFLVAQGYDVGPTGADGKFGPNTHRALEKFLTGQPPDNAKGGAGKTGAPGQAAPTRSGQQNADPIRPGQTPMPANANRYLAQQPTSTLPTMEA